MMTQREYEIAKKQINDSYDQIIADTRNDTMAPDSVKNGKIEKTEKARQEELKKLDEKFKSKNPLQEAMEKTRQNILGQGSVETWKNIAEANNGDAEAVEEREQNAVDRRATAIESYDDKTSKAKSKGEVEKAQKIATTINADADYDKYATWKQYYDRLKRTGLTDEQIKIKLKGSKWDKKGSKFRAWRDNEKTNEKTSTEESPEATKGKTVTTGPKVETPKTTTTKTDEVKPTTTKADTETAEITSREVKDNLQRNQFAQYRNSLHPSTIGAIVSKDSGLSASERVSMALKAVGKLTGNIFIANGMSLLGDDSYFARIGEGLDLDSMTSEEQKKVSNELANQIASEAVDVQANKTVIERELADMPQAKKDYLSASAHALISLSPENFKAQLKGIKIKDPETKEVLTFTDDEINNIIKIKPMLQNNSKTTRANQSDIVDTKAKQRDFNFQNFKNASERTDILQKIDARISELEKQKADLGEDYEVHKAIKAYGEFAQTMGQIGAENYTSSTTKNSASQSASQWNASLGVKIPFVDIGGGGGNSWGNSENAGSSNGSSISYNPNYEYGGKRGEQAYNKWWNDNGKKVYDLLISSIDTQIRNLQADREKLASMPISADDALIPNGEIESIQLKDGSTVVPNENDGAVLTTNPVSDSFLTFGEGEENPFDYLGYKGKKLTQEEAERIFDKEPLSDYESIMAYLES